MTLPSVIDFIIVPSGLISFAINCSLGIFVYRQNPRSSLNRFFAIFALSIGFWSVGSSLENLIADESMALRVLRVCYISASFLPTLFLHFIYILTHQPLTRRRHLQLAYAMSGVLALLTWTPFFIRGLRVIEPYGFRVSDPGLVYYIFFVFFCVSIFTGLKLVSQRIGHVSGNQQRQLQYIFLSHVIAVIAGLEYFLRIFRVMEFPPIDDYILLVYFLVFAYAIVRHRLLDIQIVLQRSVVYSILIAGITGTYLAVVMVMEKWFQGFFGYRSLFSTVFVAFLIAIFFNPLRNRIQALVDRALFKGTALELAAQREQLLSELRKNDQMKAVATLAAGLAHEIKNPLTSIKTFTEYLETRYADPDFRAKFKKIVGREVERIHLIVQQFLEFAKPIPPRLMPVELSSIVDETLEFLNGEFVQRHVEVTRRYETSGPILGDPQQLKQVFLNLFLNSLQAMNGRGSLNVATALRGKDVMMTIIDNGSGVDPKDLPRIFEPFFTTKATGTGLGLSVVHGIVKEHGGHIRIESQFGEGTTVEISLPIVGA